MAQLNTTGLGPGKMDSHLRGRARGLNKIPFTWYSGKARRFGRHSNMEPFAAGSTRSADLTAPQAGR